MMKAIEWGVNHGARVLIEDDHIHLEPSTRGHGYVEVKQGDRGKYIEAYRILSKRRK